MRMGGVADNLDFSFNRKRHAFFFLQEEADFSLGFFGEFLGENLDSNSMSCLAVLCYPYLRRGRTKSLVDSVTFENAPIRV